MEATADVLPCNFIKDMVNLYNEMTTPPNLSHSLVS